MHMTCNAEWDSAWHWLDCFLTTTKACGEAMEEVEDLSFSQRMHAAPGDAQSPGVHDARHGKV